VDTTIVPSLGIDGKPINYVAIRADITERKAASAELVQQNFALDQHAIVAITDVRGTITYVNDKFCRISKYAREELLGQNHKLINSGHHPRLFFWELYRAIAAGEVWHGEICNRAKDGSLYWVDTTIVPVLNDAGKPVSYVAIRADITTRKNLEESLARHRDQALEASRLKSEFLANMSHEIRTPMNGIIGMSGLLLDSLRDEKQREMGRVVIGSAENLLVIINDILDFSKIEAGKLRIQPEEFELRSALEETLALLAPRANEKGLELLCDFDERLDAVLLGDAGRIRQMLTNLVGNAIKFTEYGEVLVRVKWMHEEAEHVRFHASVRDTGIGLSAATQARLFEPFFQADGTTTRNYGGTGLGLAITRQLVEHMGGRIGVNSVEGEGAEFWFELDLPRIAPGSGVKMAPLAAGTRVLVVDDNATNRKILIGQITAMGGSADSVGSGAAALARLQFAQQAGEPFSAAVLDWHMPAMDGLELAARIRAGTASAAIPLIMLSSSGPLVSPGEEARADFAAYLTKPVRKEALHRALLELSRGPVPAPKDSPAISVASPAGFHLLLAEDNSTNRQVAQLMLEKLGMAVDVAKNGREALELLARRSYDGVLMDCQMPVLDGYEATRRIRGGKLAGVNPQIPIIALTAHARPEDRTRCLEAGMSDYVTKPIRPTELKAALERCGIGPNQAGSAAPVLPAAAEAEGVFDEETLRSIQDLPGINGPSLLLELARLYLSDEAERLAGLTQLANAHEGQLLAEAVHGFGGNAASFGGLEVRQVALDLEDGARAGDWEEVSVQLERLRKACQRLRAEVARRKLTAA